MKIDELPQIKEVLQKSNLIAKKSLGQNFLFDLNLTSKIANLNGSLVNATVLEIGPGPGALTRALLASGVEKVIAIEKDKYSPSLEVAFKISDVFQKPLENIFKYK